VEGTNFKYEPTLLVVDASGLTMSKKGDYKEEKMEREQKGVHQITYSGGWKNKENSLFQNNKRKCS
jgi:hypothetical protein